MDNELKNQETNETFSGSDYMEKEENVISVKEKNANKLEALRQKYKEKDGKIYQITTVIQEDDEEDGEKEFIFIFRKPGTASYERYAKTSTTSNVKALKAFVMDNICDEQRGELEKALEEYPAMALNLGERLLNMLGFSKDTQVKKL